MRNVGGTRNVYKSGDKNNTNDPITCSVYYAPINTIQIYKAC